MNKLFSPVLLAIVLATPLAFAPLVGGGSAYAGTNADEAQVRPTPRPEPMPRPEPRPVPEPRPGPTDTGDPGPK